MFITAVCVSLFYVIDTGSTGSRARHSRGELGCTHVYPSPFSVLLRICAGVARVLEARAREAHLALDARQDKGEGVGVEHPKSVGNVPALRVLVLEQLHCLKRHLRDVVFRARCACTSEHLRRVACPLQRAQTLPTGPLAVLHRQLLAHSTTHARTRAHAYLAKTLCFFQKGARQLNEVQIQRV